MHKLKIQQLNSNNNNNSRIIKQKNIRKMSTMPEEEGSEDIETDNKRTRDSIDSYDDESQSDEELDQEKNKLLDSSNKKIIQISNIDTTKQAPTTNNNNKKSSTNLSNESIIINDKINATIQNKCQNNISINDNTKINSNIDSTINNKIQRDNSINGCGKINKSSEFYCGKQQYRYPSMRSLKLNITNGDDHLIHHNNYQHHHQQYYPHYHSHQNQPASSWSSITSPTDIGLTNNSIRTTPFYDTVSIRSLASIGMGSSDGRKLTIRRVPTSPSELINMVHPPT